MLNNPFEIHIFLMHILSYCIAKITSTEKVSKSEKTIFPHFVARDSAEASAEASVDLAEASVSAES